MAASKDRSTGQLNFKFEKPTVKKTKAKANRLNNNSFTIIKFK